MNCKDCIHYDVCNLWTTTDLIEDEAHKFCNGNFKEKGLSVELPCNIGDTVYIIRCVNGRYKVFEDTVERFIIGKNGLCVVAKKSTFPNEFGIYAYTDKEKAENYCEELQKAIL